MTLAEYHNILREVIEEVNMLKQEHNICGLVMGVDAEVEFQPCHLPFTGSGLGPDKQVPPRQWGLERQFEGAFVELPGTQERYLANMNMEWTPTRASQTGYDFWHEQQHLRLKDWKTLDKSGTKWQSSVHGAEGPWTPRS